MAQCRDAIPDAASHSFDNFAVSPTNLYNIITSEKLQLYAEDLNFIVSFLSRNLLSFWI